MADETNPEPAGHFAFGGMRWDVKYPSTPVPRASGLRPQIIRTGIARTVVLIGRWAIKIPTMRGGSDRSLRSRIVWFCRGVIANDVERLWSSAPGCNPVLFTLGVANVSRRAIPVDPSFDDYEAIKVADWMPGPGDRKPENVGIVHGELVWLDFEWVAHANPQREGEQS